MRVSNGSGEETVYSTEDKYRVALEDLLSTIGWVVQMENPNGIFVGNQLKDLRKKILNAYKVLGYEELSGLFK